MNITYQHSTPAAVRSGSPSSWACSSGSGPVRFISALEHTSFCLHLHEHFGSGLPWLLHWPIGKSLEVTHWVTRSATVQALSFCEKCWNHPRMQRHGQLLLHKVLTWHKSNPGSVRSAWWLLRTRPVCVSLDVLQNLIPDFYPKATYGWRARILEIIIMASVSLCPALILELCREPAGWSGEKKEKPVWKPEHFSGWDCCHTSVSKQQFVFLISVPCSSCLHGDAAPPASTL